MEAVKRVWINSEVFKRIAQKGREQDNQYRYINNSITKGAQPLVSAWSTIVQTEALLKDKGEQTEEGHAFLALPDESMLNITQLRQFLDLSLRILGMANAQLVTSRKASFRQHLHKDYQDLCDKKRPFTDLMFGTDIKGQIDDITKLNRITSKIDPDKKKGGSWSKQSSRQRFLGKSKTGYRTQTRGHFSYKGSGKGRQRGYQQQQQHQIQTKKEVQQGSFHKSGKL